MNMKVVLAVLVVLIGLGFAASSADAGVVRSSYHMASKATKVVGHAGSKVAHAAYHLVW